MKLREANVSTGVCLSTPSGYIWFQVFSGLNISGLRSLLRGGNVQGVREWVPWVGMSRGEYSGSDYLGVSTRGGEYPRAYSPCTAGKWVVRILLECFLVLLCYWSLVFSSFDYWHSKWTAINNLHKIARLELRQPTSLISRGRKEDTLFQRLLL